MNYEEFYNGLLSQTQRAITLVDDYYTLQPLVEFDNKKSLLFDVFLIDAIPNGISEILKMVVRDEHWLKIDADLGIKFEQGNNGKFVNEMYNSMCHQKEKTIATIHAFAKISGDELLEGILTDIEYDLARAEIRLELLKAKLAA